MSKRLPFIILGIGIVGLFFSIMYLFSNTPDQNNKAISKIQNTKIEKTEDKVTRTANSTTSSTKIDNQSTQTKENKTTQQEKNLSPKKEILIVMPGYFFNDDFIALAKKIKEKENIIIKYQSFENLQQYQSLL